MSLIDSGRFVTNRSRIPYVLFYGHFFLPFSKNKILCIATDVEENVIHRRAAWKSYRKGY